VHMTEHDRYRNFRERLTKNGAPGVFTDSELATLVADAASDPDPSVRESELGAIADLPCLSSTQRAYLRALPLYEARHLQARLTRAGLLSQITSEPLTESLFGACLSTGDAVVQRELLERPGLTPVHLRALKESGANRAVRNMASQRLRTRSCQ